MRIFIDQIENGMARILIGEDEDIELAIPVEWLPIGVKEGDVLRAEFSIDADSTDEGEKRVQDLYDKLGDNP